MDINRDNYEEFFLDFAEGNLSAEQEETLNNFLKFNPDLESELKDFDLLKLTPEDISMPSRDSLKRNIPGPSEAISSRNFEMYSIAYLENDLSEYQRSMFEAFLNSDEKYKESHKLIEKTFLQVESVPYPHKGRLRKRSKAVINLRIILPFAAAAAIALLLLIRTDFLTPGSEIADLPETELPETKLPAEGIDIEPVVAKPPVKGKAASIQIIRNSRSQVPVSNIKNRPSGLKPQSEDKEASQKEVKRIAGLNLSRPYINETNVKDDQIVPLNQQLPSVNMSSLALTDRVRYQLNRASGLMDEDDVFIWNLASQGIEGINKRAGTDMSLMASKDQEGSVSGFRFKSRFLSVTAPLTQDKY